MNYHEASDIAKPLIRHVEAMKACEDLDVGECFLLDRETHNLNLLEDILKPYNVGKCIIIVDWPKHGKYEVQRLPDDIDPGLFRKHFKVDEEKPVLDYQPETEGENLILRFLRDYIQGQSEDFLGYDKKIKQTMIDQNDISHTLLQRRFASIAVFRKNKKVFNIVMDRLISTGVLQLVDKAMVNAKYGLFAKFYSIDIDKL